MLPLTPRLIVEPDDGLEPVREFIESAETSLLIKQFAFTEESLIQAAIDRKNSGVDVRVMLNPQRSGGDRANDETYEKLKSAGINVQWSNPKFYVTREKSIVVDEKAALVATFNLHPKYFSQTRDYGIITHHPHRVTQIIEVFNADWEHRDWACSVYEGLLWSNSTSRYHMAQFIDTAKHVVAALFGLCFVPVVFILVMGFVYFRFKEVLAVKGILPGASAAAVALTLAMVIKTGQKCLNGVLPVMLFVASFGLNGLLRWPLPESLAILAPLSLVWAWPRKSAA